MCPQKVKPPYDVILASEIIEHVIDTDKFLENCNKLLKNEGHLILTTPNIASLNGRVRILFGRRPLSSVDPRVGPGFPGHVRAFDYSDLKELLKDHHFKIIKAFGYDSSQIIGKTLNFLTRCRLFLTLCGNFTILAQKYD